MTAAPTISHAERESLEHRYGVCWSTEKDYFILLDKEKELLDYHKNLGTSHWYLPEIPKLQKKAFDTEEAAYRKAIERKAKIVSLVDFKLHSSRSAYIYENGLEIYVRKSHREGVDFELANINAKKPGRGKFTEFLDKYEPMYSLFIENVLNPRLEEYLQRRGYEKIPNTSTIGYEIPSFIRRKK